MSHPDSTPRTTFPPGLALCFGGCWEAHPVSVEPSLLRNPTLRASLDRSADLAQKILGVPIAPVLAGEADAAELWASPAGSRTLTLALQLADLAFLRSQGVAPAAVLGHGAGLLAALVACGAWGPAQAFRVLRAQLEALQLAQQAAGWPLGALALCCPAYQRDALLALAGTDLGLARIEAPGRFLLAGLVQAVERTLGGAIAFQAEAWLLPGEGAWHTPWLEPARAAFEQAVAALPCRQARVPLMATHDHEPLSSHGLDPASLAAHLARNLVQPLDLPRTVERLAQGGIKHFAILGPDQELGTALTTVLADRPHRVLRCQPADGHGADGLAKVRAFLDEQGHLHPDAAPSVLEPLARPVPGATLARLLESDFLAWLEEREPAVAALLLEAHGRYRASTGAAPPRAGPDPEEPSDPIPALAAEEQGARAPAPNAPPLADDPTHIGPDPQLIMAPDPEPTPEPAGAARTDKALPVVLLTVGSRPLARDEQEHFTCQRALLLTDEEPGSAVGERLRGAGVEVLELAARLVGRMGQETLAQALAGRDTLVYLAHAPAQRALPDAQIAQVLVEQASLFYRCFQALAPLLRSQPLRVVVPVAQDGTFGVRPRGVQRPLGAFPAAWVRCLQRELPSCRFQLLDAGDLPWPEAIEQRIDSVARHLELGRAPFGMVTPTLVRVGARARNDNLLVSGDLVLGLDCERGPGFEYALALARRTGARLLLTGRTPAPTDRPTWLDAAPESLELVLGQLMHELTERQGLGPAAARQQVVRARAQWELARNLDRLRSAGISARYQAVERLDSASLERLRAGEPLRGVLVAPPPLPRQLPEDPGEFLLLTSFGSLLGLLEHLDPAELRVLAVATPLAGWIGQTGQGPLALAGDMLAWQLQALGQRHPGLRTLSFAMGGQGSGSTLGDLFLEALLGTALTRIAVGDLATTRASGRALSSFPLAPRPRDRLLAATDQRSPRVRFERAQDLWLDQHRLDDEPSLPPSFVAEIFAEQGRSAGLSVKDLRFRRPVPVRGAALDAELMEHDGRLLLVPRDRSNLRTHLLPRLAFASCRLGPGGTGEPAGTLFSPRELLGLHEAAQEAEPAAYTLLDERFAPTLGLGPIFRGIRSTRHTGDRFLGLVSLSDEALAALALPGEFAFQPVLCDLAMQVAMAWALAEHEQLVMPRSLASLRILGTSREREAVVVCKARDLRSARIVVDLVLREPDGSPLLVLEELSLGAVAAQDDPEPEP
ncbi:MAG: polyketide synthase dehydratase domain-containing protein [Pseudomonadota bacterium]